MIRGVLGLKLDRVFGCPDDSEDDEEDDDDGEVGEVGGEEVGEGSHGAGRANLSRLGDLDAWVSRNWQFCGDFI